MTEKAEYVLPDSARAAATEIARRAAAAAVNAPPEKLLTLSRLWNRD